MRADFYGEISKRFPQKSVLLSFVLYMSLQHTGAQYDRDVHGVDVYGVDVYGADVHGVDVYGVDVYGVPTISRLPKIIGLFCKRAL